MKIIVAVLITTCVLAPAAARSGEIRLVSDKQLCDNAPPLQKAAALNVSKAKNKNLVSVTAELNCAYTPGKTELREWRNAATIAIATVSPSGLATACMCQHQMKYEITGLYEGTKTIYYVQDGTALGHVSAP
jgi:hypothetical protein